MKTLFLFFISIGLLFAQKPKEFKPTLLFDNFPGMNVVEVSANFDFKQNPELIRYINKVEGVEWARSDGRYTMMMATGKLFEKKKIYGKVQVLVTNWFDNKVNKIVQYEPFKVEADALKQYFYLNHVTPKSNTLVHVDSLPINVGKREQLNLIDLRKLLLDKLLAH